MHPGRRPAAPQSASGGPPRRRQDGSRPRGPRVRRGHVLGGVDGHVDPAGEERLLDLLHEDTARADLAEWLRSVAVPGGRDRDDGRIRLGACADARTACSASASLLSRLSLTSIVTEAEQMAHCRRRGRPAPASRPPSCGRWAVQELRDDLARERLDGPPLARRERGETALGPLEAPRGGSTRRGRGAREIAGTTSSESCQARKASASSLTIASARTASSRRPATLGHDALEIVDVVEGSPRARSRRDRRHAGRRCR